MKYVIMALACLSLAGCGQIVARQFGGTSDLILPCGKKLVNITWKEAHLWYLERDMKDDEHTEEYSFKEQSNLGILQGTINVHESKCKQNS